MPQTVVPMIHVPDVRATIGWYTSIGFTLGREGEEDGEIVWAKLSFGNSGLMLSAGGKPSAEHRRLKDRVPVVEGLYDAFYGMREFILRDINGFWITFGQPIQSK